MLTSTKYKTPLKEKWQLAAGIVSIYLPIRIFVSNATFTTELILGKSPLWAVEYLVNLIFFWAWIGVIEYIHERFDRLNFPFAAKFPSRLLTYLIGFLLAMMFNIGFVFLWKNMETTLNKQFNITIKRTEPEKSIFYRQQKSKANTALTLMAMLATIYMVSARRTYAHLQKARLHAERLERENLQTQFLALKNQLSPHFLFNSFSILTSLIEKDPPRSVTYVNRLSKSYRYILEQSGLDSVSLQKELDFIDAYTFLLKSRFEEKIHVMISISHTAGQQFRIAPLTLQLLIENAVRHNQMSEQLPLNITVEIIDSYLVVTNPIRKRPQITASTKIGLQNIILRYDLLTKNPVYVLENQGQFTVKIPLLK